MTGARTTRGTDEAAERIDRRRLLTRGATAAGVAWVAPVVASSPAAAGPGTPLPALPLAAIGDAAGNSWTSSDNGATWTLSTTPVNGQSFGIATDGRATNRRWVAVGSGGGRAWYSSNDGVTWTTAGGLGGLDTLRGVATDGNGNWVAVGLNNSWYSPPVYNGQFWDPSTTPVNGSAQDVATDGQGTWLAVGTTGSRCWRSTNNGLTWTNPGPAPSLPFAIATDGNGNWVAVGLNAGWRSTDAGASWTTGSGINGTALDVATDGNGRWVAVGTSGRRAWYSTNGLNWTNCATQPDGMVRGVTTDGNGTWVAVGETGARAWISTDGGVNWSSAGTPTGTTYPNAVAFARLLP